MTRQTAALRDGDGRIQVWALNTGAVRLAHVLETAPNSDSFSAWSSDSSVAAGSDPALVANADSHLELFVQDINDELRHQFRAVATDLWSEWLSLGDVNGADVGSAPAVGVNELAPPLGRLEVFVIDDGGKLAHIWQTSPNNGWSGWASLDRPKRGTWWSRVSAKGDPALGVNGFGARPGRIEVFVRGSDDSLWHIWQLDDSGSWSSWGSLGHPGGIDVAGDPVVGRNADGRLEVFVEGDDDQVWHIWQLVSGGWSSWARMPRLPNDVEGKPAVANNVAWQPAGRLELAVRDDNGNMNHVWQLSANGSWSEWQSLGIPAANQPFTGDPALVPRQDGLLEVFALTGSGTDPSVLWRARQTPPSGWSAWETLGMPE